MAKIKETTIRGFDSLIGGTDPAPVQEILTISGGQGVLKCGSVLGKITTSGKLKLVDSTATDGSEVATHILVDDTDTTTDVQAAVYQAGMFNRNYLLFGGSDTPEQYQEELRVVGIYLTKEH